MEAASSTSQPKSRTPIPQPQDIPLPPSPPPSTFPRTPASTAYIPPHLRKTLRKKETPDIDSLSQSINRITLTDFESYQPTFDTTTTLPPLVKASHNQKKGKPAQRVYGNHSPSPRNKNRKMADKDPRIQPSKASGGIPDPTPAYLALSAQPYHTLPSAKHLLVVIDLNGTLLYRPSRKNPTKFVARPHTLRFLRYCIDTFTVVIWSSARPENVKNMCDAILTPSMRSSVLAIWGREAFNFTPSDYNLRVQCYKRLSTLWNNPSIASSHPNYAAGGRWDQTNTVLVDDSIIKGSSEPFNLIEIPEFFGDDKEQGHILPQVHDHLNKLAMCDNVSAYMRACPFSTSQELISQNVRSQQQKQPQQQQQQQARPGKMNPDVIEID